MNGFTYVDGESEARRLDYVFFLLGKAFQSMGTSAYGSASMATMLGGMATDSSKEWCIIFNTAFSAAATATPELLMKYRTHMNITFAVTAKELAMAWVKSPAGLLQKDVVQRILGVQEITVPVSPNNIEDTLRMTFARVGLTGNRPQALSVNADALTVAMDGGGPAVRRVVGVPFFMITGTGTLTARGQALSEAYHAADLGAKGGALALSFYTAFQTLKNWDEVRPSFTTVGAIARDPRVQIASALLDASAGIRAVHGVPGSVQFTQGVSAQIFSRMFASGPDRFFSATSVTAQVRTGAQATSGSMMRFVTLGTFAGAVGVVLAGFQAIESFRADDMAASIGNSLIAAGGLVILITGATGFGIVAGAIVGGLMIIAGTVATFFGDSDVDYWVRHSFWGSSRRYWDGEAREEVNKRIEDAKSLVRGIEPYKSSFEQELRDYKDLTGTLRIENESGGDMRVEIFCPGLESVADLGRLSVSVRTIGIGLLSGPQVDATKHFVGPGLVHVVLNEPPVSEHDRISDLRIDASYPKLNGKEFSDRLTIKAWAL